MSLVQGDGTASPRVETIKYNMPLNLIKLQRITGLKIDIMIRENYAGL